eukprot:1141642-Pelagomonas_calceolata.AAC.4
MHALLLRAHKVLKTFYLPCVSQSQLDTPFKTILNDRVKPVLTEKGLNSSPSKGKTTCQKHGRDLPVEAGAAETLQVPTVLLKLSSIGYTRHLSTCDLRSDLRRILILEKSAMRATVPNPHMPTLQHRLTTRGNTSVLIRSKPHGALVVHRPLVKLGQVQAARGGNEQQEQLKEMIREEPPNHWEETHYNLPPPEESHHCLLLPEAWEKSLDEITANRITIFCNPSVMALSRPKTAWPRQRRSHHITIGTTGGWCNVRLAMYQQQNLLHWPE